MIAENLFRKHQIDNSKLEQEIQLKYIGAFRLTNQPENARKHLKSLLDIIVQRDEFATANYFQNAGRLGSDFMEEGQLDSALRYFQLALQSAEMYGEYIYHSSMLNNLGMLFERKKNWEKAIQFYTKASNNLLYYDIESDSVFLTSINDNKANYYFQKEDSIKGIQMLRANLDYLIKKPRRYKKYVKHGFRLFHILTQKNNWEEAQELLDNIQSFLKFGRHDWYFKNQILYHEARLQLEQQKQNKFLILKEYQTLDSLKGLELKRAEEKRVLLNNTMSSYFLLSANREIELEKEKVTQAEEDNERKTLFIVFIAIIFIIISTLIRSTSKRKLRAEAAERKIKEQELKLTELKNKRLSEDLQHTSNDFSDLMMQTSLKEDWSEELIKQLEELNKSRGEIDSSKLKEIIRGLKQKAGVYDKVNLKQKGIKEVNSAFFDHLDQKYPTLTKSERELCGLVRLRLDGKEIAVIRNIHPSSVRKLRHRLRKKLGISAEVDIYEFIAKI